MLTITDGENSESVMVIQEPQKFEFIPKSLEFPAEGGTNEMRVESNCAWGFSFTEVKPDGLFHKWMQIGWNEKQNQGIIRL